MSFEEVTLQFPLLRINCGTHTNTSLSSPAMVNVVTPVVDIEGDAFLPLSPLDAVMNTYRVVILYIYPPPPSNAANYDLDKLRRSFVSLVDEDYPVLVGTLDVDQKTGTVSVKQTPEQRRRGGSAIRFESNSTSSKTTDDAISSLSWEFMPKTRSGGEIIAVKGSILADGGMAIGVDCSHVLFDGEATLTFMKAWGSTTAVSATKIGWSSTMSDTCSQETGKLLVFLTRSSRSYRPSL